MDNNFTEKKNKLIFDEGDCVGDGDGKVSQMSESSSSSSSSSSESDWRLISFITNLIGWKERKEQR